MAHNEETSGHTDNPYTQGLATFIANLRYEDLPQDVRHRAKLLVLDGLGCGLYASDLEWSTMLRDALLPIDSSRDCAVWGTSHRLSSVHATLCNGTQVQGFELDDVHREAVMHPASVVLPPLVALAENRHGISGKDFLTAVVAGYETGPRVGMCMGRNHLEQGWHTGATLGVFSSAAAASSALHLDDDRTLHAIGIAGTQAAGLMAAQFGSMVKRMHAGRSAQSGLYGALLAEQGFTGIRNLFEAEYGGFCTTFSGSPDKFDRERLVRSLGETYETMRVSLKFYSCVASNHTTLDAIRSMQARHPFGANDVERIVVYASLATKEHVGWEYKPEGVTASQLNLGYCVATLLLEDACFVEQFSKELIADPQRMALAARVECIEDPAITAEGPNMRHKVRVEVHLKDGSMLEETVETARGSEYNFASDADIVAKFQRLASKTLPTAQVGALKDAVLNLDELSDTSELARLLAVQGAA
jgi:2-methylcitrate dehydratase PrpD